MLIELEHHTVSRLQHLHALWRDQRRCVFREALLEERHPQLLRQLYKLGVDNIVLFVLISCLGERLRRRVDLGRARLIIVLTANRVVLLAAAARRHIGVKRFHALLNTGIGDEALLEDEELVEAGLLFDLIQHVFEEAVDDANRVVALL